MKPTELCYLFYLIFLGNEKGYLSEAPWKMSEPYCVDCHVYFIYNQYHI